jgi:tetratricopeptide (TPR) repeat protein
LNRLFVYALLALAALARADEPTGQLDASPTLFTVMAALNMAGYDADLAHSHPLRQIVRDQLARRDIPSLAKIKDFVIHHHQSNDTAELSQYISLAATVGPAPDFNIKQRQVELPPDVVPIQEFAAMLPAFYKEADIPSLWKAAQPYIDSYIRIYHTPVLNAIQEVNVYLRQQSNGISRERFQIYIDLLEAPNNFQTRNYGFEYTVFVGPSVVQGLGQTAQPRTFDVRHAYLHYLLEPLATHYKEILDRKKALAEHLDRARALSDTFKEDFLLLVSESLIKAVEARLDNNQREVGEALHEGYIFAPYFAEKLPVYEKQESSMAIYYPDLVGAIDLVKEDQRLQNVEFNSRPTERPAIKVTTEKPLTGVEKTLDEADTLYASHQYDQARTTYLAALSQTDQKPMQAKAYGGMARIALAKNDPETAETLFQKALDLGPEPEEKAWELFYLGRLALAAGERDHGIQLIQEALRLPGASDKARKAASDALQQIPNK